MCRTGSRYSARAGWSKSAGRRLGRHGLLVMTYREVPDVLSHRAPETLTAAATDLASIGSALTAANASAAAPTISVAAAGADEVSSSIAAVFGAHAQGYHALSAQAASFHDQFVQALNAGAGAMRAPRPPVFRLYKSWNRICSTR